MKSRSTPARPRPRERSGSRQVATTATRGPSRERSQRTSRNRNGAGTRPAPASAFRSRRVKTKAGSSSPAITPNPASSEKRENMTIRISNDNGATWPISKLIHAGPSAYSCLVALSDGKLGLLFECGDEKPYDRIDFVRLDMKTIDN